MVSYGELFGFCMVILTLIQIFLTIYYHKK
jgi:hypothetical protein